MSKVKTICRAFYHTAIAAMTLACFWMLYVMSWAAFGG